MDPARRSRRRRIWLGSLACAATLAILVFNLPFYSGSSLGPWMRWRMEHGRLTVGWGEPAFYESFYIDLNSEGLRWKPEGRLYSLTAGTLTIPLWIVLAAAASWTAWQTRPSRNRGAA